MSWILCLPDSVDARIRLLSEAQAVLPVAVHSAALPFLSRLPFLRWAIFRKSFLGCCSVQRRANSAAFLGKPTNTPMHTKQNQPNSSHPHATNHATNHSQHLLCDGCVAQATLYQSFWSVGLNFCPAGQDQLTKGRMDRGVECKIRSSCCELSVGWLRDPTIPNQPNQPASQPSNQEAEQATNQTTNQGTNQPNNHPTIQTDESFHPAQLY